MFFELQTDGFALLAIDTGILRTVDERQWAWIERALERSRGKFVMTIVGHPRIAGGHDIPTNAEGGDVSESSEKFAALYQLLAKHNVRIAMAGDTHDFEYYKERTGSGENARELHHFVNGGGGAYLSIGTALDFPEQPPVADWAFYPRTDRLKAKMGAEMPIWKQPFWQWIKWFNAWPFSVEALSGLFDFNRAPFFQSFMEVRVERSKRRIVLALYGVDGSLRWRDLQIGGDVLPHRPLSTTPSNLLYQWIKSELQTHGSIVSAWVHADHFRPDFALEPRSDTATGRSPLSERRPPKASQPDCAKLRESMALTSAG